MKSKIMIFKDVKELQFLDIPPKQVLTWGKGFRALIKCNGGMQKLFNIQKNLKMGKIQLEDSEMTKMDENKGNVIPIEVMARIQAQEDKAKPSMK